jgi:predicted ABC-type ATPase
VTFFQHGCHDIRRPASADFSIRMTAQKKIVIIAGPNGAGKTTFAREFLPNEGGCPVFVNADLIAAGISPFQPEAAAFRAGRMMLREIAHHAAQGISFAFETTLAGLTYARMIDDWRNDGYTVKLIFLALGSAEEAIARVATRVVQGGHDIPEATIRRRFDAGRLNFRSTYRSRVDSWLLFDNSGEVPLLLEEGENT